MKILVTGAKGFVGKNLVLTLEAVQKGTDKTREVTSDLTIYQYDTDTEESLLDVYCADCDFVFHLAGVNRPQDIKQFMDGNFGFTSLLLDTLKKYNNKAPIMISSSVQAALDNPYGISKKAGEELLFEYEKDTGVPVFIYRFPNIFGKWCRPNYNSAIATFCYNIARDIPIQINDKATVMNLVYIDDVVDELLLTLVGRPHMEGKFCTVPFVYTKKLGEIAELIYSFKQSRENLSVPDVSDEFVKKLHATYLSYLPEDKFSYPLIMNCDARGSFTEIFRTADRGQFSVNISKPGITKGNHWHHTKNEKFVVVGGKGVIRLRKPDSKEIIQYFVSGEKIEVVDIPTGYTHNIQNLGDTDLVTFMWCNECFNPDKPDTYSLEV